MSVYLPVYLPLSASFSLSQSTYQSGAQIYIERTYLEIRIQSFRTTGLAGEADCETYWGCGEVRSGLMMGWGREGVGVGVGLGDGDGDCDVCGWSWGSKDGGE